MKHRVVKKKLKDLPASEVAEMSFNEIKARYRKVGLIFPGEENMAKKKKSSWATHKAGVKRLERMFGATLKRNKRGIYIVDLPNDHPILKKLEKNGKVGMLIKGKRRKLIDL